VSSCNANISFGLIFAGTETGAVLVIDSLSELLGRFPTQQVFALLRRLPTLKTDLRILAVIHRDLHDDTVMGFVEREFSVVFGVQHAKAKKSQVYPTFECAPSPSFHCETLVKRMSGKVIRENVAVRIEAQSVTFKFLQEAKANTPPVTPQVLSPPPPPLPSPPLLFSLSLLFI